MFKEGQLPGTVLCSAKGMYAWFKTYKSCNEPVNLQTMWTTLKQKLMAFSQEKCPSGAIPTDAILRAKRVGLQ
jgi:hypothetical protein